MGSWPAANAVSNGPPPSSLARCGEPCSSWGCALCRNSVAITCGFGRRPHSARGSWRVSRTRAGCAVLLLLHGRGRQAVEEILRWHEEQRAGDRGGEVENSIVVAGRVADEHVGEHPL